MEKADQMLPPAPPTRNSALTSPLLLTAQMCCPWARMQDQLQLRDVFVTWHRLREGVAGKGELSRQQRALACPAEQKWGELNPSLCPALPTSCVLGSTSRLLSKLLWVFFGLCEEIKMFFKWYSNAEVLRHWASFFTDVWEPCLQGNWGQSRI